jgi:hypothetical protein
MYGSLMWNDKKVSLIYFYVEGDLKMKKKVQQETLKYQKKKATYTPGNSVDQHRMVEAANEYLSTKEIGQVIENS